MPANRHGPGKRKDLIDALAKKHLRKRYLWIPTVLAALIIALYILIKMDVLLWSNIEPDTYILALLLAPVGLAYLLIKGKPFGSSSSYEKMLEKERGKIYLHSNFSTAGFAKLKKELEQAIKERDSL